MDNNLILSEEDVFSVVNIGEENIVLENKNKNGEINKLIIPLNSDFLLGSIIKNNIELSLDSNIETEPYYKYNFPNFSLKEKNLKKEKKNNIEEDLLYYHDKDYVVYINKNKRIEQTEKKIAKKINVPLLGLEDAGLYLSIKAELHPVNIAKSNDEIARIREIILNQLNFDLNKLIFNYKIENLKYLNQYSNVVLRKLPIAILLKIYNTYSLTKFTLDKVKLKDFNLDELEKQLEKGLDLQSNNKKRMLDIFYVSDLYPNIIRIKKAKEVINMENSIFKGIPEKLNKLILNQRVLNDSGIKLFKTNHCLITAIFENNAEYWTYNI